MISFLFSRTPLAYFAASFWRDEAFSFVMASQPIIKMVFLTAQDSNPPLYYFLLKVWMIFFGSSEVALRSLSLLFFWGTIYIAYLIFAECLHMSSKRAFLYIALFLSNPLLHYYAFETRMYSFMGFLACLSFYFLLKKHYTSYGILFIVSIYTHYFLFFLFFAEIAFAALTFPMGEKRKVLKKVGLFSLGYIPWIIILLKSRPPFNNHFWIPKPSFSELFAVPSYIFTGWEKLSGVTYPALSLFSIILTMSLGYGIFHFFSIKKARKSKPYPFFFYLTFITGFIIPLLFMLFSFFKPLFLPRYLIFSVVGLLFCLVIVIDTFQNRYSYIFFSFLLLVSVYYSSIQVQQRVKAPIRKLFSEIRILIKPGDSVYVTHEYNFHPAKYYLRNLSNNIYIYGKTYEELPWYVGKILISEQEIKSTLPYYPKRGYIIVNDSEFKIESVQ